MIVKAAFRRQGYRTTAPTDYRSRAMLDRNGRIGHRSEGSPVRRAPLRGAPPEQGSADFTSHGSMEDRWRGR
jgi:hypothetical protein